MEPLQTDTSGHEYEQLSSEQTSGVGTDSLASSSTRSSLEVYPPPSDTTSSPASVDHSRKAYSLDVPEDNKLTPSALEILAAFQEGKPHKRLNILIFGKMGAGKSSLLNSMVMSINKEGYKDIARRGSYGIYGGPSITTHLQRFSLHKFFKEEKFQTKIKLWDCPGAMEMKDDTLISILKLLIEGKLPSKVKMEDLMKKNPKELEKEYHSVKVPRRIDIVFFVHALNDEIPTELCSALAQLHQRVSDFRVYGIITKIDLECTTTSSPDLNSVKEELTARLGLRGTEEKVFSTRLYCSDNTQENKRCRDIDESMCQIWKQTFSEVFIRD